MENYIHPHLFCESMLLILILLEPIFPLKSSTNSDPGQWYDLEVFRNMYFRVLIRVLLMAFCEEKALLQKHQSKTVSLNDKKSF